MYKSPISIIESTMDSFYQTIIKQKDDAIFAEIQHSFGVDMDKDELIRALQYDRGQYEKGYADGKADAVQQWIPVTERLPEDDLPKDSKAKQIKVLVAYMRNGNWVVRSNMRKKGKWYYEPDRWSWSVSDPITHWMPLPEPPKEG